MIDARPRILLLHPGSLYGGDWPSTHPLKGALVSIYSYLRAHDADIEVLDLSARLGNPRPEEVDSFLADGMEAIRQHDFEIIGISCWSSLEYLAAVEFATRVRAERPATLIVVGGFHPTAVPADFTYTGSPFDIVVSGEGETALLQIVREAARGGGAAARVVSGTPLPMDRSYFDLDGFPDLTQRPFAVGVYMSRGCPYRCTFCLEPGRGAGTWRHYSVENALAVVAKARSYNPQLIIFHDPCFAYGHSWRHAFLEGLVDMKLEQSLWAELRADRLKPQDLDLIGRLDFQLLLGVETMSPRMATIMRKAADGERYVREVDATLRELNDRRLLTRTTLILNHPGETAETAEETVSYFERFATDDESLTVIPTMGLFRYYPGADTAIRREYYEHTYGTRFLHPEWWKERRPQLELAVAREGAFEPQPYLERCIAAANVVFRRMPAAQKLHLLMYYKQF